MRPIHKLKTSIQFFQFVQDESKTFEIRLNDRNFEVGDYLCLCEWNGENFTGRDAWRRITYILSARQFAGLSDGYVAMSIEPLSYNSLLTILRNKDRLSLGKTGEQK